MGQQYQGRLLGLLGAFALSSGLSANYESVQGELIVKLKKGSSISSLTSDKSQGVELKREINLSYGNLYVVQVNNNSLESAQAILANNPEVEYVEPNFIYKIVQPVVEKDFSLDRILNFNQSALNANIPNDPKFGDLWGLKNTGSNEPGSSTPGTEGTDVNALKAWEITKGSRNIKIAVIDTGIDYRHPDLAANMWVNEAEKNGQPGVDDDGNGYVDDIHGYDFANNDGDPMDGHSHGTHCAGTIGAVHNNGIGVAGVMADVTLVGVKFLTDAGSGTTENAIKSIDYATKVGVDLMSNSWGGGGYSAALKEAIERAAQAGIVFTAAAGNSSTNNDSRPHYPSNYDVANVISVAAHTAQDTLASFSCYGKKTVHIAAPGHKVLSTVKNNAYAVYSGTSMATPHVSGVIGLLLAEEGRMDHEQMRERVMATSIPVAAYRGKTVRGGRIDAYNLLTDTRPQRNDPNPTEWKSFSLPEAWETEHPYGHDLTEEKEFKIAGAKFIRLKIKKYDLEARYDTISVAGKNRNAVETISGEGADYVTDYIEGDTLIATFKSDRSVSKWGFLIEEIEWQ